MTDQQLTIIVGAIPSTIAAVFAGFALLQSRKNGQQITTVDEKTQLGNDKVDQVAVDLADVKQQTDGLTEKLVTAGKAEGKAAGKVEERAEVAQRVEVAQAVADKKESQKIQIPHS